MNCSCVRRPPSCLVALSALPNLFGPAPAPLLPPIATERLRAYLFRTNRGVLAVAWATDEPISLQSSAGVVAKDMMGNAIDADELDITNTPLTSSPGMLACSGSC